jgi:hypothetical protein
MGYHEKRTKPLKRNLVRSTALLAVLLLPLLALGQESREEDKKKEPETASPPSELTGVETSEERKEGLDRKLDSSLAEFDGLILKEQEILEQRRESSAAAGGGAGAGTAAVGGGAAEGGEEGAEGGVEGEEAAEARGTGGSKDDPAGEEVASEEGAPVESGEVESAETSNGRIPPDVGDGSDDDIVARQLREAAMKEEDPELREKLWDEYRAYKFGEKKKTEG